MEIRRYRVLWDKQQLATDMSLDIALIPVEALIQHYYEESPSITISAIDFEEPEES